MNACVEPRRFMPSPALPGAGLPADRAAQLAARQAFVKLKIRFAEAVSDLPGHHGYWLRAQVRATEEPSDLWMLRGPVYAALQAAGTAEHRQRRARLRLDLESMFPDTEPASAFSPLT